MIIKKIFIENYRLFSKFELAFNNDLNIVVGNNESGKSTLLEAINLVLTGQINGRSISYELSPFLFNKEVVAEYITKLKNLEKVEPPKILIELYLEETSEVAKLKGNNNSKKENATGLFILIQFNQEFATEYESYIQQADQMRTIPTEYFEVKWYDFAHNPISVRSLPVKAILIDTTSVRLQNGTDYYIYKTIDDNLEEKERAALSILYRKLKESFANEPSIQSINSRLKSNKSAISHKDLTVSLDISQKANWDANLTSYLDEIPYNYIGKGDQSVLKMVLALERKKAKECSVILIEEPENHLSFSTMNKLIQMIGEKCEGKQLVITTHSAFVLNKLGIEKLILLGKAQEVMTLKDLNKDTQEYFKKLPGYDTLRLVLSKKTILVEGPSDELFVQRAYKQKFNRLPIEDGIDVISVKGLSFKRFLDIAKLLNITTNVITDNDGDCNKVKDKYKDYNECSTINIYYDSDENCKTLEPQIVKCNTLEVINKILKTEFANKEDLGIYMCANKTEVALRIFESNEEITIPMYIQHAIE